jgi:hypothetical protein
MQKLSPYLKKYPLAPFLTTLFFFIHGALYCYQYIVVSDILVFFLFTIAAVGAIFGGSFFFFKSAIRASVFTTLLCILGFYFEYFQEGLKLFSRELIRFRFFLPLTGIALIVLWVFIKRSRQQTIDRFNYFLSVLGIILILFDCCWFGYKLYTEPAPRLSFLHNVNISSSENASVMVKPDIYFLVFDEYASSVALKENFGYDNSLLDSFLIQKGFYIATQSKSNYSATPFSISSTLNMDYFSKLDRTKYPEDFVAASNSMYENNLFRVLQQEGYAIRNYSIFGYKNLPTEADDFSSGLSIKVISGKSVLHALEVLYEMIDRTHLERKLKNSLTAIKSAIQQPCKQPRFLYIHFMLPHRPFIFRADGSARPALEYLQKKDVYSVKSYLDQLTFTNVVIKDLVEQIMRTENPSLVLLEGDHGFRIAPPTNPSRYKEYINGKNQFKNLSAYYFYDKNYTSLYDSITPVNSFRVVLHQYFNRDLPLLKDSTPVEIPLEMEALLP